MAFAFFESHHLIHRHHKATNRLHTLILVAGSLTLLAVTAWAIAGLLGVAYALVFGGVSLIAAHRISPAMVLRMYKARRIDARSFPAGHQLVQALGRRAGLESPPQLYVVPSRMMNAFAVGRSEQSAIAITDALARNMTLRELAGVLAHEITHIRNGDIKVMSLADVVSRLTSVLSMTGFFAIVFNLSGFFPAVPWLGIVAMIAAPTIGSLLQLALSRTREFGADYGAAMLTGDPDGLSSALRKLEAAQRRRLHTVALPAGRMAEPSMLRSHPPTDERIERLQALRDTMRPAPLPDISPWPARPARTASAVPRVPARASRNKRDIHHFWIAFAETRPDVGPVVDVDDCDEPGAPYPLHPPEEDSPCVRPMRGGVWW